MNKDELLNKVKEFNVAHRTGSLYLGIDFYIEMSEENNTPAPQLEQSNLE